ncbi:MAG TPA: 50S ribosomal protein L11 methyltransferase [Spirochaetota bacterium]|nr:50S ribosomal protein L11 methyltransferase [Spirochaetota bacterium]
MTKYTELIFQPDRRKINETELWLQLKKNLSYFIQTVKDKKPRLKLYLTDPGLSEEVKIQMARMGNRFLGTNIKKEKDWLAVWRAGLKPFKITPRVWINPCPDKKLQPPAGEQVLRIIPGTAFGTGLHATTKLCAEMLHTLNCKGRSLLDIGCGTGILSAVAFLYGCRKITAVDNDSWALKKAAAVFSENKIKAAVLESDLLHNIPAVAVYDIIVINIVTAIQSRIYEDPKLIQLLKKEGFLLLSGINQENIKLIMGKISPLPFILHKQKRKGDWAAFLFRRR